MENKTKQQAILMVKESISSIFSKEDVVNIIQSISADFSEDLIEKLKKSVTNNINDIEPSDIVSESEISLSIDYGNQINIEIDSIDTRPIKIEIERTIDLFFVDFQNGNI
jgi:hypothetical protein